MCCIASCILDDAIQHTWQNMTVYGTEMQFLIMQRLKLAIRIIQYTCLYSAVPPYVTDAAADVESIQQERSCSHPPPQCSLPFKESIHPQKHCEICACINSSGNINDIFAHNFASFLFSRT